MLCIARTALRPNLARHFVARSVALVHTLPDLPYSHDVRSMATSRATN
jgi:hypothetical protein